MALAAIPFATNRVPAAGQVFSLSSVTPSVPSVYSAVSSFQRSVNHRIRRIHGERHRKTAKKTRRTRDEELPATRIRMFDHGVFLVLVSCSWCASWLGFGRVTLNTRNTP